MLYNYNNIAEEKKTMSENKKKHYDEQFKLHLVGLYESGQKLGEIAKMYQLHPTTVSNWVKFYKNSGSFKGRDNLTEDQKTIKELEKSLKERQMEIDILKKAMVVMLKT